MKENENQNIKSSGLPSRPMIGSTAGNDETRSELVEAVKAVLPTLSRALEFTRYADPEYRAYKRLCEMIAATE